MSFTNVIVEVPGFNWYSLPIHFKATDSGEVILETKVDSLASSIFFAGVFGKLTKWCIGKKISSENEERFFREIIHLRKEQAQAYRNVYEKRVNLESSIEKKSEQATLHEKEKLKAFYKKEEFLSGLFWISELFKSSSVNNSLKVSFCEKFLFQSRADDLSIINPTAISEFFSNLNLYELDTEEALVLISQMPLNFLEKKLGLEVCIGHFVLQIFTSVESVRREGEYYSGITPDFIFYPEHRKQKIFKGISKITSITRILFPLGEFLEKVGENNPSLLQKVLLSKVYSLSVLHSVFKEFYPQTLFKVMQEMHPDDSIQYTNIDALNFQLAQNVRPSKLIREKIEALTPQERPQIFKKLQYLNPYIFSPYPNYVSDQEFSINFLWINKQIIDDPQDEMLINQVAFIEPYCEWIQLNPGIQINLWYDKNLTNIGTVELANEMVETTLQKTGCDLSDCVFAFRDIREAYRAHVPSKESFLESQERLYVRVDFSKSMLIHHVLTQDDKSVCCFFDLACRPMTKGEIFNSDVTAKLANFGCVFSLRQMSLENQVIFLDKHSILGNSVVQFHKEIFLNTVYFALQSNEVELCDNLTDLLSLYNIFANHMVCKRFADNPKDLEFYEHQFTNMNKVEFLKSAQDYNDRRKLMAVRDPLKIKKFVEENLQYAFDEFDYKEDSLVFDDLYRAQFPIRASESLGYESKVILEIS